MKMLVLLAFVCLASLTNAAVPNPLNGVIDAPIHDLLNGWKQDIEGLVANSTFLQTIDVNHTLGRLFSLGETELKSFLLNTILPEAVSLLRGPATDVRAFLETIRDRINSLDVKGLSLQLPNLVKTIQSYMDLTLKILQQIEIGGNIDVAGTLPSIPVLPTKLPSVVADVPKAVSSTKSGWGFW